MPSKQPATRWIAPLGARSQMRHHLRRGEAKSICIQFSVFQVLLLSCFLAGCSTPSGLLEDSEAYFDIGTLAFVHTNLRVYHSALLDPAGVHLDNDGYVIGVEKVDTHDDKPGPRRVTHVIEYGGIAPNGTTGADAPAPCIIFSLLNSRRGAGFVEPMAYCKSADSEGCKSADGGGEYLSYFAASLQRRLCEQRLRREPFTHIFVIVMGWNTDQEAAVKNYNEITNNLRAASRAERGKRFRPLVIGISWPSQWALGDWSILPVNAVKGASFWVKKDQADQVGRFILSEIIAKSRSSR